MECGLSAVWKSSISHDIQFFFLNVVTVFVVGMDNDRFLFVKIFKHLSLAT